MSLLMKEKFYLSNWIYEKKDKKDKYDSVPAAKNIP